MSQKCWFFVVEKYDQSPLCLSCAKIQSSEQRTGIVTGELLSSIIGGWGVEWLRGWREGGWRGGLLSANDRGFMFELSADAAAKNF